LVALLADPGLPIRERCVCASKCESLGRMPEVRTSKGGKDGIGFFGAVGGPDAQSLAGGVEESFPKTSYLWTAWDVALHVTTP
jgi:hypothetical protein